MRCSLCGGRVEWQGPLANLTHTKCLSCGEINCQEVETAEDQEVEAHETGNEGEDSRRSSLHFTHTANAAGEVRRNAVTSTGLLGGEVDRE